MPNLVNNILYQELERDFQESGSCLVLSFDKLTVTVDESLRAKLREQGVEYRVVKNRLATIAAKETCGADMSSAFKGKCGVVFAPEEGAISAAKLVLDEMKPHKKDAPVRIVGGIIEGEAIVGDAAEGIANMPDRNTVNAQIATAIAGPARQMATILNAVQSGLARCVQAKVDKEGGEG